MTARGRYNDDAELLLCRELTRTILSLSSTSYELKEISNIAKILTIRGDRSDDNHVAKQIISNNSAKKIHSPENRKSVDRNNLDDGDDDNYHEQGQQRTVVLHQMRSLDESLRHLEDKVALLQDIIKEERASLDDLETKEMDYILAVQHGLLEMLRRTQKQNNHSKGQWRRNDVNSIADFYPSNTVNNASFSSGTTTTSNKIMHDDTINTTYNNISSTSSCFPSDEEQDEYGSTTIRSLTHGKESRCRTTLDNFTGSRVTHSTKDGVHSHPITKNGD
jgi:hypothetical protein